MKLYRFHYKKYNEEKEVTICASTISKALSDFLPKVLSVYLVGDGIVHYKS